MLDTRIHPVRLGCGDCPSLLFRTEEPFSERVCFPAQSTSGSTVFRHNHRTLQNFWKKEGVEIPEWPVVSMEEKMIARKTSMS